MKRVSAIALVLAILSLALLPTLHAEDWSEAKAKVVQFGKKDSYSSQVFSPVKIAGDQIQLPTESGSLKVKVVNGGKTVLVDTKGNGDPNFTAFKGGKTTPFELTLTYGEGEKNKYYAKVARIGSPWYFIRDCAIEATIDGTKFWFVDDNCNGSYGDDKDAVYYDKKPQGCPYGSMVVSKGKVYEVRINASGTKVEYKPYDGKTGAVDILKDWNGKAKPDTIIVKSGENYFDIGGGGETNLPLGSYLLTHAFLPEVTITGGNSVFEVADGEAATLKWGMDLKISAQCSIKVVKGEKQYNVSSPVITGASGERYSGAFMENPKFFFEVFNATANGKTMGKGSRWTICTS